MIAHDMRTPLNALHLGILAAKSSQDPKALQAALELAQRNIKTLSDLVESLVDLNILGKGELSLCPVAPADLVKSAVDQVTPMSQQKGVTIIAAQIDTPPIVADKNRLIRVLANLLSNAIRFANKSVIVEVRTRANDGHETIIFSVSDDGPGVPIADIDRIFIAGVSISNSGKASKGLGLAVCKEIVEAHGGRIWAETGKTSGATFSFSIPTNL